MSTNSRPIPACARDEVGHLNPQGRAIPRAAGRRVAEIRVPPDTTQPPLDSWLSHFGQQLSYGSRLVLASVLPSPADGE
jgi:hypothetical protein